MNTMKWKTWKRITTKLSVHMINYYHFVRDIETLTNKMVTQYRLKNYEALKTYDKILTTNPRHSRA